VRTKIARSGKPGAYRFYVNYDIPEAAGGGTIRLRANQTTADRAQNPPFNREKHLHPEGEEDLARLYGRRRRSRVVAKAVGQRFSGSLGA